LNDKRVDPSVMNNMAIQNAVLNGHTEIVKILLNDSRVDPSANDNLAIRNAKKQGHMDIVQLLSSDEHVDLDAEDPVEEEDQNYVFHFKFRIES
jgi:ankyrin repeat protein